MNLDGTFWGTFAEIGAGQEVARWFFSVGGAAGTVAKTMSAYDMTVSDAIYDKAPRYVSRERIDEMLTARVHPPARATRRGATSWPSRRKTDSGRIGYPHCRPSPTSHLRNRR